MENIGDVGFQIILRMSALWPVKSIAIDLDIRFEYIPKSAIESEFHIIRFMDLISALGQ
jgi:hypothetical protein